jgi:hypothetical protein
MQGGLMIKPLVEGEAEKTTNNIKAAILMVFFTASPFSKLI